MQPILNGTNVICKIITFLYGAVCYMAFLLTFVYAIGFVGNFLVPKSIDTATERPIGYALIADMLLLALFALQHSIMARPGFKRWWTKLMPQPVERSTYVLCSSLVLLLLFRQWQPLGGNIWNVQDAFGRALLEGLFAVGWSLVLVATFLINHFDLFGLRQVYFYLCGKEYTPPNFGTPGLYKLVRHPLYLGWLLAFWSTPTMTAAHLLFAVVTTAYILIAIQFEERDLLASYGEVYAAYRRQVPMLLPGSFNKKTMRTVRAENFIPPEELGRLRRET